MMLRAKVVTVFALCLAAFARGMPQDVANGNSQSPTSPPFLQFTDGGIRLNFAGFHAQAGLGGLLGGTGTGGGLHASAGTPWGASAAAGLGGALDGNNGTARGGLYATARSGFGPSAAAGLGGQVGGSGSPNDNTRGGMFAGATSNDNGNQPPSPSSASAPPTGPSESSSRGRSNIQIISRKTSTPQFQVEIPDSVSRANPLHEPHYNLSNETSH